MLQPTLHPDYEALDPKIAPLVRVLNEIGLPIYYSGEGHGTGRNITQYEYPIVVIAPEATPEQALIFLKLTGMLGLFNSCASDEGVEWVLEPLGNPDLSVALRPADTSRPLRDLQNAIRVLAYNLGLMSQWY